MTQVFLHLSKGTTVYLDQDLKWRSWEHTSEDESVTKSDKNLKSLQWLLAR